MKILNLKLFEKYVIGPKEDPMLIRYILFRTEAFGIFLHNMKRSDYAEALHDHPWPFVSLVLWGGYTEVHDQTLDGKQVQVWHAPGSVLVRPAEWRHRFVLPPHNSGWYVPSWTLVFVGRRFRRWGFFTKTGWCWWRKFDQEFGVCEEEVIFHGGKD